VASEEAEAAYVVLRPTVPLAASASTVLHRLNDHEIARREVTEWPGTQLLLGATATLIQYRMSSRLADLLASMADGLYEWAQPNLPEDLGFLRDDGSTWLASISHERDSYVEMSRTEEERLLDHIPELSSLIAEEKTPDTDP
jgi:hypothetical protein